MCFTEIHVRRKPELGGEQEASEHLKEGGKTHEPKSTTTTTTTTLPSRNPQCQGPQPELGEGHSGTNHMLWCTLPTGNIIALQFLLKSHIFLPYLAVGMVRESTIDAAIINLSCNKSTKEEKEDGEAGHSQHSPEYTETTRCRSGF